MRIAKRSCEDARNITKLLVENDGNVKRTAGMLGISRSTLLRKITDYNLEEFKRTQEPKDPPKDPNEYCSDFE